MTNKITHNILTLSIFIILFALIPIRVFAEEDILHLDNILKEEAELTGSYSQSSNTQNNTENLVTSIQTVCFDGFFEKKDDIIEYTVNVDYRDMDSVAFCFARTGSSEPYTEIYDSSNKKIACFLGGLQPSKKWNIQTKTTDTIESYTIKVTVKKYVQEDSSYRIIVCNPNKIEEMLSGPQNAAPIEMYYNSRHNSVTEMYIPNNYSYWFKSQKFSKNILTIHTSACDSIRFRIREMESLNVLYDSAYDKTAHKKSLDNIDYIERLDNPIINGNNEYYIEVYNKNPEIRTDINKKPLSICIGNPVIIPSSYKVSIGTQVLNSKSYSKNATINIPSTIPKSARVEYIELSGFNSSKIIYWKAMSPDYDVKTSTRFGRNIKYPINDDSYNGTKMRGNWQFSFKGTESTLTNPNIFFVYRYEYGG
ncbi:MAG: hypothetical protein K6G84_08995 [Lachnospiraceae bacterium]|nr:hypothetical protein [Lachnospiraceae bacterium]